MTAKLPSNCVSQDILRKIVSWRKAGASTIDVVDRLRIQCVPPGYIPKPWNSSMIVYFSYDCTIIA